MTVPAPAPHDPAHPADTLDLTAILRRIGATPERVSLIVAGLDDDALRQATAGVPSGHALLRGFVADSVQLGRVAHAVLGHVPGAGESIVANSEGLTASELLAHLHYLRAHIVSTVAQQGEAVWFTPTDAGRPLLAYADDLVQQDAARLTVLRAVVTPGK